MFFNYLSGLFNKALFAGNYLRSIVIFSLVLSLWGCNEFTDDLNPSGSDQRAAVVEDVVGSEEGQILGDFTLKSTVGNTYSKDTLLAAGQPVVLYFTMWCPICDSHMSHYINEIAPDFPNVSKSSLFGIAVAFMDVRVRIIVWLTSGRVNSVLRVAATAAKAGTPGVMR